eukprot:CAMPEP_0197640064 /NCGR_PEP_ID=MMETSP1338-20131121/14482_1 /TAXON_ID=43686 ORGANISM="Pelagodinium beii, Strain RCC1491" /NCGR_SAMPLE_ID=MMETSP1338 /ASSEMBLY_ACC=CAM_ASM_000754 /LENGTH=247 /DNA_ID=CAMNT_0043212871 /DNA_START=85 /DNA_END=828 /DNA_ORIENTATION=-
MPEGSAAVLQFGSEFSAIASQRSSDRDWTAQTEVLGYGVLPEELEIVFVGDGRHTGKPGVGKTTLLLRCRECLASTFCGYSGGAMGQGTGYFNEDGTVRFHNCEYEFDGGRGATQLISIRDSADHQGGLRTSSYAKTSAFLIVFSLDSRSSFDRVASKWAHEVPPEVPVVLIGTKSDLGGLQVSFQEGQAMAKQIGAADYLECSALSGAGLDDVLDATMWAIVTDAGTETGRARLASLQPQAACNIM